MFDVGDEIGPYKLVRRLGAGGMGEVFQGRHRHMHRDAAIKVLREEMSTNAEVVRRFFTEARATAAVRHPAIIEIFDCDVHPRGAAFIVMELLEGEDLAKRITDRGSFAGDLPGLRAIVRQVASGLGAAHDLGIVHRDLKPGNVFLSGKDGAVKILDFGIAKLLAPDNAGHERTRTGNVLGTPLYMSPEQARGAREVDHRADVYALGCVMYEMLAGKPPFVDKAAAEVIVAHIFKPAPRLATLVEGVPAGLDELVMAMLEKDPAKRPQTMKDVVARLDALADVLVAGGARVATQLLPSGKAAAAEVKVAAQPVVAPAPPTTVGRDARQFTRAGTTTLGSSASELEAQRQDEVAAPRGRRWVLPAAGAGVAAVAALVFALRGSSEPAKPVSAAPPPVAAPAVAPTPAPAAAPMAVSIDVRSQPTGAEVWVAGEATARGRTPVTLKLEPSTKLSAQLRAPGRASVDVTLDASAAHPITVVMPPVAPAEAPRKARPKKPSDEGGFKAIED
jgi:serine/threonine-protein kinase